MTLRGKKIGIGVCGGIAAYKACELIRLLKKSGAEVRVVMTQSAAQFVSELTLATLSENRVATSLFSGHEELGTQHIDLARWCDAVVVCPATANMIAKTAAGIADDFLTTTILATEAKVLICPAMNSIMWAKSIVQENIDKLTKTGYDFVAPEWGELATSTEGEGWGRLAAPESILKRIEHLLLAGDELAGCKVLVTAGPTREAIDPVRFWTNYSTGKMGFALAEAAALKGAEVVLISGPNHLRVPAGVRYIEIESAVQLADAVNGEYSDTDVLLMSAAVSDYRPKQFHQHKLKKSQDALVLELEHNPDILADLGKKKGDRIHVGFALETQDQVESATLKLKRKNLDLIVLNNPLEKGAAFGGDTNIVTVISRDEVARLPKMAKKELALDILDRVSTLRHLKSKRVAG